MTERPLTNKQQAFCREYVKDSNGSQAAIRAGYSKAGSTVRGSELLTNRKVTLEISRIQAGLAQEVGYSVEQCQAEYEQARVHAVTLNQPSAEVSAITGKARLYGMDKDHEIGSKEAAVPVTAEQTEEYRAMACAAIKLKLSKGA